MHRISEPDPKLGGSARHMCRVGAGDQCLCRNAAGIDASAAKRAAFNDRNLLPAAASSRASGGPACPVPTMMAS
jgi:hypothetical protein